MLDTDIGFWWIDYIDQSENAWETLFGDACLETVSFSTTLLPMATGWKWFLGLRSTVGSNWTFKND